MASLKILICTKMIGSILDNIFVIWVISFSIIQKVLCDNGKLYLVITKMMGSYIVPPTKEPSSQLRGIIVYLESLVTLLALQSKVA